ncbi:MAG: aldehyde dehydrogenase family protein [Albidovulum sp.]|nr:aldehyde dehydrogenase family protein [Albidovulum sp.]
MNSPSETLRVLADIADRAREDASGREPEIDSIFVGNAARGSGTGATLATLNPSREVPVARFSRAGSDDVHEAAESARGALEEKWSRFSPQKRGELLFALAERLEENENLLATLETLDVGKPLSQSKGDVGGAAATLRYNAGAADKMEGASVPLGFEYLDFTELEPLGATAHITPWNFPLGMAARSIAPALAAGCTAVLKPAEQSPLTSLAFAALAAEAGFPPGALNVVTGLGDEAGAELVNHPMIGGITFTGSVATGRRVGAAAGRNLKPAVLELGGNNPLIVFSDADLDRALDSAVEGAFDNSGQVCSSVSRLLVENSVKDEFLKKLADRSRALKVGDGFGDVDLGPLVSAEQLSKVTGQIAQAAEFGARALAGGARPEGLQKGYFIEPTIFDNVDSKCRLACEETFGPVVAAFGFSGEDEALEIANSLPYGLAAGIHTSDIDRALRLARGVEAGTVWINGWFIGGVQAPTGGVKDSGYGRERGIAGIQNYLRIKNIGVRIAERDPYARHAA